jgi:hypothetical protein
VLLPLEMEGDQGPAVERKGPYVLCNAAVAALGRTTLPFFRAVPWESVLISVQWAPRERTPVMPVLLQSVDYICVIEAAKVISMQIFLRETIRNIVFGDDALVRILGCRWTEEAHQVERTPENLAYGTVNKGSKYGRIKQGGAKCEISSFSGSALVDESFTDCLEVDLKSALENIF